MTNLKKPTTKNPRKPTKKTGTAKPILEAARAKVTVAYVDELAKAMGRK